MYQKTVSNYVNGECRHKIQCRSDFQSCLIKLGLKDLRYVGLPALSPSLEKVLLEEYAKVTLFLAEVNPKIFKKQKKLFPSLYMFLDKNIIHKNSNIFECMIPFKMNAVWLDLCSMLQPNLFEQLSQWILSNRFDKEGIFALTFFASRERELHHNFYYALQANYNNTEYNKDLKDFRTKQLPKILTEYLKGLLGAEVKLLTHKSYIATSGIAPMQYFSFKWNK